VNQVWVKFWEVVFAENRIDSRGCTWKTMISNWSVSMYTTMRPAAATSSLMTSSWILSSVPWTASNLAPTDTSSPPPPPGPAPVRCWKQLGQGTLLRAPSHLMRRGTTTPHPVRGSPPHQLPLFKNKNKKKFLSFFSFLLRVYF
jgi:hypothetical protein